jgi:hypothetical protein
MLLLRGLVSGFGLGDDRCATSRNVSRTFGSWSSSWEYERAGTFSNFVS